MVSDAASDHSGGNLEAADPAGKQLPTRTDLAGCRFVTIGNQQLPTAKAALQGQRRTSRPGPMCLKTIVAPPQEAPQRPLSTRQRLAAGSTGVPAAP
jgi:hypothetical protein